MNPISHQKRIWITFVAYFAMLNPGMTLLAQTQPIASMELYWDYYRQSVDISPDGRLILTGGARAAVWDATTGKAISTAGEFPDVVAVKFSPDSASALAGGSDYTAVLFDVLSGEIIHKVKSGGTAAKPYGTGETTAVAFSHDGKRFLTSDPQAWFRLWDTETGELIHDYRQAFATGYIEFLPDGNRVLIGESGVVIYDLEKSETLHIIENAVQPILFNHGKYLFYKDYDEHAGTPAKITMRIIDINTFEVLREKVMEPYEGMSAVDISPDGKWIMQGGTIAKPIGQDPIPFPRTLWDGNTFQKRHSFPLSMQSEKNAPDSPDKLIRIFPDGKRFLTVNGNKVYVWDISDLTAGVKGAENMKS